LVRASCPRMSVPNSAGPGHFQLSDSIAERACARGVEVWQALSITGPSSISTCRTISTIGGTHSISINPLKGRFQSIAIHLDGYSREPLKDSAGMQAFIHTAVAPQDLQGLQSCATGYLFARLVGRLSFGRETFSNGTSAVPLRCANIHGEKFGSCSAVILPCQCAPSGTKVNIGCPSTAHRAAAISFIRSRGIVSSFAPWNTQIGTFNPSIVLRPKVGGDLRASRLPF
jgi:hypothetical protein